MATESQDLAADVSLSAGVSLELDSDSLPPLSSEEPSDLPWLPDTDASRWVDMANGDQAEQWGAGNASTHPEEFDPASAFEQTSSAGHGSQTEPETWEAAPSNSADKRQRLNSGRYRRSSTGIYSPDYDLASPSDSRQQRADSEPATDLVTQGQDDDERSSGDFQGHGYESNDEDVIRALGVENVRRLASMTDGELADFEESSSDEGPRADGGLSDSCSEVSSEDIPRAFFCLNCTNKLYAGQTICESAQMEVRFCNTAVAPAATVTKPVRRFWIGEAVSAALTFVSMLQDCNHEVAADRRLFSTLRQAPAEALPVGPGLTGLAYDDMMLEHEEGRSMPHPERPNRIKAIISRLMASGLAERCKRIPCREATAAELATCHTAAHIDSVVAKAAEAGTSGEEIGVPRVYYGMDTYVRPSTFRCASMSAGGAVEAACAIARGECRSAAAIIRPPGHHAESNMAMGFCFFNNAAIAARAAQAAGMEKVMILDWDVHHGNGTQHIFEDDKSVLYMSIHRYDRGKFFPGTGAAREVGKGAGIGKTVNVPWETGDACNGDYIAAFHRIIMPITYEFAPDLIIISAGFDAAEGDPLGGCHVTPECYAHMTAMMKAVAPCCVLLEGGYNLQVTAEGTEATLRVLLGENPPALPHPGRVSTMAAQAIREVVSVQALHWKCLRPFMEHPISTPFESEFQRCRWGCNNEAESPRSHLDRRTSLTRNASDALESLADTAYAKSKLNAVRQQGKSQRKLALMHALHLVAVKHRLKAHQEVSKKLADSPCSKGKKSSAAAPCSPLSPLRRARWKQLEGPIKEEDPFMTQDSDSNDRNPLEFELLSSAT